MLDLENIDAYYGDSHILHGVSLSVKQGEVVCLLGRNGAGKTTTILTIMGYLKPRQGRIRYDGRDIASLPPYAVARLGVGFVPQERGIFQSLTVRENLMVFARAGWEAILYDPVAGVTDEALGLIRDGLGDQARHGLVADPTHAWNSANQAAAASSAAYLSVAHIRQSVSRKTR